jgi:transcriptional regulator with XRE-family HTH domain
VTLIEGDSNPAPLGKIVRDARLNAKLSLRELAHFLDISPVHMGQIERGLVPMNADQCEIVAKVCSSDLASLIEGAKSFNVAIWNRGVTSPVRSSELVMEVSDMRERYPMPPEVRFVEYREGWFAGASGRANPGDMSPDWDEGHEDGRLSMERDFNSRRVALETHYGDGEAGSPTNGKET